MDESLLLLWISIHLGSALGPFLVGKEYLKGLTGTLVVHVGPKPILTAADNDNYQSVLISGHALSTSTIDRVDLLNALCCVVLPQRLSDHGRGFHVCICPVPSLHSMTPSCMIPVGRRIKTAIVSLRGKLRYQPSHTSNTNRLTIPRDFVVRFHLTLWRSLLAYSIQLYSIPCPTGSRRHLQFLTSGHSDAQLWSLSPERQSVRMSKITNDGLTRSGTACFIAVPIWQQWASKG